MGRRGEGRRRRGRKGGKQSQGMDSSMILYESKAKVWIHDFCMILGYKLLGYDFLGFSLDINLVPFSRVFLGRHPNSRFKESLVENP